MLPSDCSSTPYTCEAWTGRAVLTVPPDAKVVSSASCRSVPGQDYRAAIGNIAPGDYDVSVALQGHGVDLRVEFEIRLHDPRLVERCVQAAIGVIADQPEALARVVLVHTAGEEFAAGIDRAGIGPVLCGFAGNIGRDQPTAKRLVERAAVRYAGGHELTHAVDTGPHHHDIVGFGVHRGSHIDPPDASPCREDEHLGEGRRQPQAEDEKRHQADAKPIATMKHHLVLLFSHCGLR